MHLYSNEDERVLLLQVLLSKTQALSYLEKYFLIRVIHFHGVDVLVDMKMSVLSALIGIKTENLTKIKTKLQSMGVLSIESVEGRRGRPIEGFTIHSEALLDLMGEPGSVHITSLQNHRNLVLELLCYGEEEQCYDLGFGEHARGEREFIKDGNHDLDAKERMLIAVLLAHADPFGFVEGLGQADILSMLGFSSDQLRNQVRKLKRKGYIRSTISGFTHPRVFGKVPTIYCLNTLKGSSHENVPLDITFYQECLGRRAHERNEANQILAIASKARMWVDPAEEKEVDILVRALVGVLDRGVLVKPSQLRGLLGSKSQGFRHYLQYFLESYACKFLSLPEFRVGFKELETMKYMGSSEYQSVVDDIERRISSGKARVSSSDINWRAIANIFAEVSFAMAKIYVQFLKVYNPKILNSQNRDFRVLPRLTQPGGVFKSLYITFVSNHMDAQTKEGSGYTHVYDNRLNIEKGKSDICFSFEKGEIDALEKDQRLKGLRSESDFLIFHPQNEEQIPKDLRHQCGLSDFIGWEF